MRVKTKDLLKQNRIYPYLALGTILLLSIPFLMMRFHIKIFDPGSGMEELNWNLFDFLAMGTLIFGTSFGFVQVARHLPRKYRMSLAAAFFLVFLWIWAELAVGIFTNWGS